MHACMPESTTNCTIFANVLTCVINVPRFCGPTRRCLHSLPLLHHHCCACIVAEGRLRGRKCGLAPLLPRFSHQEQLSQTKPFGMEGSRSEDV